MSEHEIYNHELVDGLKDQVIQFIDAMATIDFLIFHRGNGVDLETFDAVDASSQATKAFTGLLAKAMIDSIDAEADRRGLLRSFKEHRQYQQEKSYQQASVNRERKGK